MLQGSLLMLWMDENTSQQSNKNHMMGNLQLLFDLTTKQARTAPTWGIEVGALDREIMLEILMYLSLVLIL